MRTSVPDILVSGSLNVDTTPYVGAAPGVVRIGAVTANGQAYVLVRARDVLGAMGATPEVLAYLSDLVDIDDDPDDDRAEARDRAAAWFESLG